MKKCELDEILQVEDIVIMQVGELDNRIRKERLRRRWIQDVEEDFRTFEVRN